MRSLHRLAVLLPALVLAPALAPVAVAQDGLSITFLANEGVLLSGSTATGSGKVLIDGLFLKYGREFAVPAESTQAVLRGARPPFDAVDLLLVTHRHGDHFHPAPVAAHLRANPRALLLTSRQVIDSLRSGAGSVALPERRVVARTLAPGRRRRALVNGIPVELLGLPHSGGRRHRGVEHLGYLVELGGRRVLHVGDAELSEATLAPFRLDTARVDVALLPWWALTDEETRRAVERWIRPREIVAFHVSEGEAASVRREVGAAEPGAHVFSRSLETLPTPP